MGYFKNKQMEDWFDDQEDSENKYSSSERETDKQMEETSEDIPEESDYFSESVFEQLPEFISKVVKPVKKDKRDRDIMLFSALIALSACFPTVYGQYRDKVHANLYGLILAPAASGKGLARYAAALLNKINKWVINRQSLKTPSGAIEMKNIGSNASSSPGSFFISANSSVAALMQVMKENEEIGNFMFETELDVVSSIMEQKWGNQYSENLRKIFQHEPISSNRKCDGMSVNESPKLSTLLTGTPNQFGGSIRGVQDGLFSRCAFYAFTSKPEWKSPIKDNGFSYESYYQELSNEVFQMFDFYRTKSLRFSFTESQVQKFDAICEKDLMRIDSDYGEDAQSLVIRQGLITFRIAMILTVIRSFKKDISGDNLICEDVDFETAMSIRTTLLYHSLSLFKEVQGSKYARDNEQRKQFRDSLPNSEFRREDAVRIGESIKMAKSTVDKLLRRWLTDGRLKRTRTGYYQKV